MECSCKRDGNVVSDICAFHMRVAREIATKTCAAVVAAEREACAKVADAEPAAIYGPTHGAFDRGYQAGRRDAAKAIRNRKPQ